MARNFEDDVLYADKKYTCKATSLPFPMTPCNDASTRRRKTSFAHETAAVRGKLARRSVRIDSEVWPCTKVQFSVV